MLKKVKNHYMKAYMKSVSYFHQDFEFKHHKTDYFEDPCHSNQRKYTPLILSVLFGMDDLYELLIKKGANIDYTDAEGLTALMHACKTNDDVLISKLLKFKPRLGVQVLNCIIKSHETYTFDNDNVFKTILDKISNYDQSDLNFNIDNLYKMAVDAGAYKIKKVLEKKFEHLQPLEETLVDHSFAEMNNENEEFKKYDVTNDALKMLSILESLEDKVKYEEIEEISTKANSVEIMSDESDDDTSTENSDNVAFAVPFKITKNPNEHNDSFDNTKPPRGCEVKDGDIYNDHQVCSQTFRNAFLCLFQNFAIIAL